MILDAQSIVKNFGGLTAVNHVSMQVDAGEIVGLIGPNGAGKTTFLNCVAGTYRPSEGNVLFEGKETTGDAPEVMCRLGLSRTFQIPRPFPRLTAMENVMVGARFGAKHGGSKSAQQRAEEMLAFVKFPLDIHTVDDGPSRKYSMYSVGSRRRARMDFGISALTVITNASTSTAEIPARTGAFR